MKKPVLPLVIFILCLANWLISLYLFWNMAVFCDEYNTTPLLVCGGETGLFLDWVRMVGSFLLCLLAGLLWVTQWRKKSGGPAEESQPADQNQGNNA